MCVCVCVYTHIVYILYIYICSIKIPPIMIVNRLYENQNFLSL